MIYPVIPHSCHKTSLGTFIHRTFTLEDRQLTVHLTTCPLAKLGFLGQVQVVLERLALKDLSMG